jgi:hypothetical protein
MTVQRAFIIESPSPTLTRKMAAELLMRDQLRMTSAYAKKEALERIALIFYDRMEDKAKYNFEEIARLVVQHGNTRMPFSAFRKATAFNEWPANYATIEAS